MLVDDQPSLGGHLRFSGQFANDSDDEQGKSGAEMVRELAEATAQSRNIEVMNNTTAFGLYQDRLLAVLTDEGVVRLRAGRVVLATGVQETPLLFDNNDLPGVMLASAALRLTSLYGVRPGRRALVVTDTDEGYQAALELLDAGVEVAAVVDAVRGQVRCDRRGSAGERRYDPGRTPDYPCHWTGQGKRSGDRTGTRRLAVTQNSLRPAVHVRDVAAR